MSPDDVEAEFRRITRIHEFVLRASENRELTKSRGKERFWVPSPESGVLACGIDPEEWFEIEESQRLAFHELFSRSLDIEDDTTCEDILISMVKHQGLEEASEHCGEWLSHFLETGNARIFERLAKAIRDSRNLTEKDRLARFFPKGSSHSETAVSLVCGWAISPSARHDFPPFAVWTYDALTEFFENACGHESGREGIRRLISSYKLHLASVSLVSGFRYSKDHQSFELKMRKRKRPVKRPRRDINDKKVSRESDSTDTN